MAARRANAAARREKLIEQHTGIVQAIARQLSSQVPSSFELDDLIAEGYVALTQAATRYRPANHGGAPFSVYARFRVRGAMLDYVGGRNWDRVKRTDPIEPAGNREDAQLNRELRAPEDHTHLEARIDQARQRRQIGRAVAQLPPRLRTVIELHYGSGIPLFEVAPYVDCGASRASSLHIEALTALRRTLQVMGYRRETATR